MNEKQDNALKFGHELMVNLGLTPVVAVSSLLELMIYGELRLNTEVDFFINGEGLPVDKIIATKGFHNWHNKDKGDIFYVRDPNDTSITFVPYYSRGSKTYANIYNEEYFVWDRKHFDTLQTKLYRGMIYNIPYDPIGYLETYYGKPWDDFDGRKGWHWKQAKNLQTLKELPV
jgi:hypothetical protein